MDFKDALNSVIADLTPQPWTYTTPDGTTLTVIPAGLRDDPGRAEVNIRVAYADATGLGSFGLTTPDSRGVAEVGVPTASLPALIEALTGLTWWMDTDLIAGSLFVAAGTHGVVVAVGEVHGPGQRTEVSVVLPKEQRMPLASALSRALDVARGWEG